MGKLVADYLNIKNTAGLITDINGNDLMNKTFYVDATNGDDNNDGSSNAPFATIQKAVDSVPIGGYAVIYLQANQTFTINADIYIVNKTILFVGNNVDTSDNSTFPVINNVYNSSSGYTTGFRCRNVTFLTHYVNFETANLSSSSDTLNIWEGIFKRHDNSFLKLSVMIGDLTLGDTDFIRTPSGSHGLLDVYLCNINIKQIGSNRNAYIIYNEDGNISFVSHGSSAEDSSGNSIDMTTLVYGIVKDSNGVPRNIISNLVF